VDEEKIAKRGDPPRLGTRALSQKTGAYGRFTHQAKPWLRVVSVKNLCRLDPSQKLAYFQREGNTLRYMRGSQSFQKKSSSPDEEGSSWIIGAKGSRTMAQPCGTARESRKKPAWSREIQKGKGGVITYE